MDASPDQKQQHMLKLRETIKQAINESDCTYRDAIVVLNELQAMYKRESLNKKVWP